MPEGQPAPAAPKVPPYAWVIVAVLAVTLTIASGARFLFGVVLKPVSEQFGWDRAQLTAIILDGVPGTPMPPWRPLLSEQEARWIADKLKTGELLP